MRALHSERIDLLDASFVRDPSRTYHGAEWVDVSALVCQMLSDSEQDDLVGRAVAGDGAGLERLLLSRYSALAKRLTPRIPAAHRALITVEDLLQQVFVEVFRDIGRLQPTTSGAFDAWLRVICEHRLLDAVRFLDRRKRGARRIRLLAACQPQSSLTEFVDLLLDSRRSPSHSAAQQEAAREVQIELAALPEDQRQAITYRYLQGHSLEETADLMARTSAAIRGLLHRGKAALRAEMGVTSKWFTRR
jgi:RNA polymerase sigma-70 factor, ECF subfamily